MGKLENVQAERRVMLENFSGPDAPVGQQGAPARATKPTGTPLEDAVPRFVAVAQARARERGVDFATAATALIAERTPEAVAVLAFEAARVAARKERPRVRLSEQDKAKRTMLEAIDKRIRSGQATTFAEALNQCRTANAGLWAEIAATYAPPEDQD